MEPLEPEICNELEKRDARGHRLLSKEQWADVLSAYETQYYTSRAERRPSLGSKQSARTLDLFRLQLTTARCHINATALTDRAGNAGILNDLLKGA